MGKCTWIFLLSVLSFKVSATVDGNHWISIVVANYNEPDNFTVERVPMIGCWGLAHGPEYSNFTRPYEVPMGGCGGNDNIKENINALTCAEITNWTANESYTGTAALTLDISKCEYKSSTKFLKAVKEAVAKSFTNPKGKPPVKLTIVK